jgi:hypothetical protein
LQWIVDPWTSAKAWCMRALAVNDKLLGTEDANTLSTQVHLADVYQAGTSNVIVRLTALRSPATLKMSSYTKGSLTHYLKQR